MSKGTLTKYVKHIVLEMTHKLRENEQHPQYDQIQKIIISAISEAGGMPVGGAVRAAAKKATDDILKLV